MAKSFNITAQMNLASPTNIAQVRSQIQKQLGNIPVSIKFNLNSKLSSNIGSLNKKIPQFSRNLKDLAASSNTAQVALTKLSVSVAALRNVTGASSLTKAASNLTQVGAGAKSASYEVENFGKQAGIALRRFSAFAVAAGTLVSAIQLVRDGFKQALEFQNEMVRLSQVTNQSLASINKLGDEIGRLSSTLGVSSKELSEVATTLAQAGFSAKDTQTALSTLAKTDLAPTFDNMASTTEGLIAIFRQFNLEAYQIEGALGAVNAVSAAYAVESKDIIEAVKRAGGVFKSVGGNLNEFISLFSAVRDTTRLSAETIATGMNTIFTRLERPQTLKFLKTLGVDLLDVNGQFIGAFQAVQKLGDVIGTLGDSDPRLIQISEYLAGYRQLKVIIPLIRETAKEQEALRVAQNGLNSLSKDSITSQQSLIRQFTKLKEEFLNLIRAISNDTTFQGLVSLFIEASRGAIALAQAIKPLVPLIAAVGAVRAINFGRNVIAGARSGRTLLNSGGPVPGVGNRDTVPAMLTPGEFVIRKKAVEAIGVDNLHKINENGRAKFARGGLVGSSLRTILGGHRVPSDAHRSPLYNLQDDALNYIASFIPGGSTFLGSGVEAAGFRLPNKNVLRIGQGEVNRIDHPLILQALKKKTLKKNLPSPFTLEELPFAPNYSYYKQKLSNRLTEEGASNYLKPIFKGQAQNIYNQLLDDGLLAKDVHMNNIGVLNRGKNRKFVLTDPGFISSYRDDSTSLFNNDFTGSTLTPSEAEKLRAINSKMRKMFASGGKVDSVPAMLTPGEFVLRKEAAQTIGANKLHKLNHIEKFASGGFVGMKKGGFTPSGVGRTTKTLGDLQHSPNLMGDLLKSAQNMARALMPGASEAAILSNALDALNTQIQQYGSSLRILVNTTDGQIVGVKRFVQLQNIAAKKFGVVGPSSAPSPGLFEKYTPTLFRKGSAIKGALGNFASPGFIGGSLLSLGGGLISQDATDTLGNPASESRRIFGGSASFAGTGAAIGGVLGLASAPTAVLAAIGGLVGYFQSIQDVPIQDALSKANKEIDVFTQSLQSYTKVNYDAANNTERAESIAASQLIGVKARSNPIRLVDDIQAKSATASFSESASIGIDKLLSFIPQKIYGGKDRLSIFGLSDSELENRGKAAKNEALGRLGPVSLQALEKQARDAAQRGEITNEASLKKVVSGDLLKLASEASGVNGGTKRSVEQIIADLFKAIRPDKLSAAVELYEKELLEAQRQLSGFGDAITAFTSAMNDESVKIKNNFDLIDSTMGGSAFVAQNRGDVFNNLGGATDSAINEAINQLSGLGLGSESQNLIRDISKAQRELPRILREAAAKNPIDSRENFATLIDDSLKRAGFSNNSITKMFSYSLKQVVGTIAANDQGKTETEKALSNVDELVNQAFASTDVQKALGGFAQALEQNEEVQRRYGKALEQVNQLMAEYNQGLSRVDDLAFERDSLLAQFEGRNRVPNDNRAQNRLGRFGFGSDPTQIFGQLQQIRGAQSEARLSGDVGAQVRLQNEIDKARSALELLADAGTLVAHSFEKLNKVTERRQNKEGLAKSFFGSDLEGRFKILQDAALLKQAKDRGSLDGFNIEQQMRIIGALEGPLGKLPGVGEDFLANLLRNSGGLAGAMGENIFADRNEEKALQQDIISTYNRAIEAQELLSEDIRGLASGIDKLSTEALISSQGSLKTALNTLEDAVRTALIPRGDAATRANGGPIYASRGFKPKGTDTVPALAGTQPFMLTPGEFIINKRSSQKYAPLLQAINKDTLYAAGGFTGPINVDEPLKGLIEQRLKFLSKTYGISFDKLNSIGYKEGNFNVGGVYSSTSRSINFTRALGSDTLAVQKRIIDHELGHYVDDFLGGFSSGELYSRGQFDEFKKSFGSDRGQTASKLANKFAEIRNSSDIALGKNPGGYLDNAQLEKYYFNYQIPRENFADMFAYMSDIGKNSSRKQRAFKKENRATLKRLIAERDIKPTQIGISDALRFEIENPTPKGVQFSPRQVNDAIFRKETPRQRIGVRRASKLASRTLFRNNPEAVAAEFLGGAKPTPGLKLVDSDVFDTGQINGSTRGSKLLVGSKIPGGLNKPLLQSRFYKSLEFGKKSLPFLGKAASIGGAGLELALAGEVGTRTIRGARGEYTNNKVTQDFAVAGTQLAGAAGATALGAAGVGVLPLLGVGLGGAALGYGASQLGELAINRNTAKFNKDRQDKVKFERDLETKSIADDILFRENLVATSGIISPQTQLKNQFISGRGQQNRNKTIEQSKIAESNRIKDRAAYDERAKIRDEKLYGKHNRKLQPVEPVDLLTFESDAAKRTRAIEEEIKRKQGFYYGGEAKDKLSARLSQGEYVVNARSARKHRDLIEQINADTIYRAKGGTLPIKRDRGGISEELKKKRELERRSGTRAPTAGKIGVFAPRGDKSGTVRPKGEYYKGSGLNNGTAAQRADRGEARQIYEDKRAQNKTDRANNRADNRLNRELEIRNNSRRRFGLDPVDRTKEGEAPGGKSFNQYKDILRQNYGGKATSSNTGGSVGPGSAAPISGQPKQAPLAYDPKNGQVSSGLDTKPLQEMIKQFNDTLSQFKGLSIELKVQDIKIDLTDGGVLAKLEPALKASIGNAIIAHINKNLVVPGGKPVPNLENK